MVFRIFFLFLFAANIAFAQTDPYGKKATILFQKESIENVLTSITQQTGVRFSYNSQIIDPKTKVSINAQNKTVKEILSLILPSSVSYKKVGEHIVFFAEEQKGEKNCRKSPSNFEGVPEGWGSLYKEFENTFSDNGNLPDNCLDSVSLTKNEEMKTLLTELMLAVAMAATPLFSQDSIQITETNPPTQTLITSITEANPPTQNLIPSITEANPPTQNLITLVADSIPPEETPVSSVTKPIQLTFVYPLGTGWVKSACKNYNVSLNILGGVTGQTKGVELGGLFNINTHGAKGAQFAGLFNLTGSGCSEIDSRNVQFAGLFNLTKKGKSAQFAGIFNTGDTAYFQAGGIFNIAKQAGAQISGIFNIAQKSGAQFGGIFNLAKQSGAQFAGIANVAEKSACQIAGIVNITKKGKFQMGLINVRDTADGVSLGLINIVKKGGILEAGIEAGEFVHTAVTFRSGVQRLYSIISVGYNYVNNFWTFGYGLGTSFKLVKNLGLNIELNHITLFKNISRFPSNTLIQLTPLLNYRIAKHLKIYAGPSLNFLFQAHTHYLGDYDPTKIRKIKIPYKLYHWASASVEVPHKTFDLWIGVVGGIKF